MGLGLLLLVVVVLVVFFVVLSPSLPNAPYER